MCLGKAFVLFVNCICSVAILFQVHILGRLAEAASSVSLCCRRDGVPSGHSSACSGWAWLLGGAVWLSVTQAQGLGLYTRRTSSPSQRPASRQSIAGGTAAYIHSPEAQHLLQSRSKVRRREIQETEAQRYGGCSSSSSRPDGARSGGTTGRPGSWRDRYGVLRSGLRPARPRRARRGLHRAPDPACQDALAYDLHNGRRCAPQLCYADNGGESRTARERRVSDSCGNGSQSPLVPGARRTGLQSDLQPGQSWTGAGPQCRDDYSFDDGHAAGCQSPAFDHGEERAASGRFGRCGADASAQSPAVGRSPGSCASSHSSGWRSCRSAPSDCCSARSGRRRRRGGACGRTRPRCRGRPGSRRWSGCCGEWSRWTRPRRNLPCSKMS